MTEAGMRIGLTTFEMVKEDYWPIKELDMLLLERQRDM